MDWYQNKRRITITAVGKRAAVANTRFCFGKDHIPVMKERYYRIERKRRQAKNTRLLLLGGIAAVVCVGVLAAAIVMYSTVGQKAPDGGLVGKNPSSGEGAPVSSQPSSSDAPVSSEHPASSQPPVSSAVPVSSAASDSSVNLQLVQNTMVSGFDFSKPVAESAAVDLSFFDDAAIIGDSRAVGLVTNTQLKNHASSFAKVSCTALTVLDGTSETAPIIESLEKRSGEFKKVYIMLGINEIGYQDYGVVMTRYGTIIDRVKKCQPDADVYIQTVLPITKNTDQKHNYLRKSKIADFNARMQKLAAEKKAFLVDPTSVFAGSDGFMVEDAVTSKKNLDAEIHFNKTYCQKWLDYLTTHTVK